MKLRASFPVLRKPMTFCGDYSISSYFEGKVVFSGASV